MKAFLLVAGAGILAGLLFLGLMRLMDGGQQAPPLAEREPAPALEAGTEMDDFERAEDVRRQREEGLDDARRLPRMILPIGGGEDD